MPHPTHSLHCISAADERLPPLRLLSSPQAHEVAAEMLSFYERHATPIPAAEAQRLLDLLGLPQLPYPQQQQAQQQAQQKEQQRGQQPPRPPQQAQPQK